MKEIYLTINGNREIPVEVDSDTLNSLSDVNQELTIVAKISPDKVETILSHDDSPHKLHVKVKIVGAVRFRT